MTPMNWSSLNETGLWVLAVIPLAVAGILAALQVGTVASMLVTGGGAAGSGLMGAIGGRLFSLERGHEGSDEGGRIRGQE